MAKFDNPLNNLRIASPCSQDWNAMIGDDRKRYCGECKLNVFNLSGMSQSEAENLVMNAEGRLCVRFFKRADGSVLTQDCPVGWAKVKQRTQIYVTALASLIFSFFGAIGLVTAFNKSKDLSFKLPIPFFTPTPEPHIMGGISPSTPTPTPKQTPKATPKPPLMGKIATPKNTPEMMMGDVAVRKN